MRALVGPGGGEFRRFWLATAISVLGTWMAAIALAIRMFDLTGSPGWVSALLFAEFTPVVLIGFLVGDRLNRLRVRRSLVICDIGSAAVFAALALISTPWAVVALAALGGVGVGVFRPLATAAVPMLVADDDLEAANGALGSVDHTMTFLGELIGGFLVATVGADLALGLNSASFLVSAILVSSCGALAGAGRTTAPDRTEVGLARGFARTTLARIHGSPVLLQIAIGWTIATFVIGVVLAVQVPLLRGTFHASPTVVGLLLGLDALGLVAGSLPAGAGRHRRLRHDRRRRARPRAGGARIHAAGRVQRVRAGAQPHARRPRHRARRAGRRDLVPDRAQRHRAGRRHDLRRRVGNGGLRALGVRRVWPADSDRGCAGRADGGAARRMEPAALAMAGETQTASIIRRLPNPYDQIIAHLQSRPRTRHRARWVSQHETPDSMGAVRTGVRCSRGNSDGRRHTGERGSDPRPTRAAVAHGRPRPFGGDAATPPEAAG